MQLAELNLAVPRYPPDDPRMAGFMDNIMRINALAARTPGFIWRFPEHPEGHPEHEPVPWPNITLTLSTWADGDALQNFVWNTVHKRFYSRRAEWFAAMEAHHLALWWVEDGHRPTLAEAKARLDHLNAHGDSDHAFGWAHLTERAPA